MKKSKLSVGLVTSFISAMALTACGSSLKSSDKNIVSFTGADGKTVSVLTDSVYQEYLKSSSGISTIYDKVLEVLIRHAYQDSESDIHGQDGVKLTYDQIVIRAKQEVTNDKNTAKTNAKTNGTSYSTEWKAILESHNVEDEKGLRESYIYKYEKEQVENWYLDKNEDELKSEFIGLNNAGEQVKYDNRFLGKLPYHIRHILVNVDSGSSGTKYTRETITESQANKLVEVYNRLSAGIEDFGTVAKNGGSEDTGSAAKYGDVGIMQNTANSGGSLTMVPEFQLGIYAYDNLLYRKNDTNQTVKNGLGLTASVETELGAIATDAAFTTAFGKVAEVPYSVFADLDKYADVETNKDDHVLYENSEAIYPRNILWNRYLNHHDVFLITNRTRVNQGSTATNLNANLLGTTFDGLTEAADGKCGFRFAKDLGLTDNADVMVLTDENAQPIFGVRSQYGIHFMIIQKSINDFAQASGVDKKVSLSEYYTTAVPKDDDFPRNSDGSMKSVYVNYIRTTHETDSTYTTRADEVASAIKGIDATYDYRLYELLASETGLVFNGEGGNNLKTLIDEFVKSKRDAATVNQGENMELAWQTYLEMLTAQYATRKPVTVEGGEKLRNVIPEGCIVGFNQTDAQVETSGLYKKGGACYYGK